MQSGRQNIRLNVAPPSLLRIWEMASKKRSAERRTREIGIRKVMGAGVVDVVKLLLWQFSKPVVVANILAWPIAFYSRSFWLERLAYHVSNLSSHRVSLSLDILKNLVSIEVTKNTEGCN